MNIPEKDFKRMIDTLVHVIIKLKKKGVNVAVLFSLWRQRKRLLAAINHLVDVVDDLRVTNAKELLLYSDAFEKHFDIHDGATEAAIEKSITAAVFLANAVNAWRQIKHGFKF